MSAAEFRSGQSVRIEKDEVIKSDLFATSESIRVEGTVDGDIYAAGKQVEVSGHVTGDVICGCQSLRISGQVDGNVRNASNNLTITGSVGRNVTSFTETFSLDRGAKIGYSLMSFSQILTLDGNLGRDLLAYFHDATIEGAIGGEVRSAGDSLNIGSSASIGGNAKYEGRNPAHVASSAKLASPLEYKKLEHRANSERGSGYYIWRLIWASAYVIFGLVLLWVLPQFSREATLNVDNAGASIGLGVLVGCALPIAAIFACITVVGLFVGISALFLWYASLYFAQIIVGAAVGQWIIGRTDESWPLVGRMVVGVVLLRIGMAVPYIGMWFKLAVVVWGIGAISLAVYRRLQPVMAPNIPSVPTPHLGNPLPPNTTVGGM
jgi:cytoskeletal protein CcmA (bactofilin family)